MINIKRKLFLFRINRKIKQFGASIVLFEDGGKDGIDTLEIKIGQDFCHIKTMGFNYNKYFIEHIIKEVIMKKIKQNTETGIPIR